MTQLSTHELARESYGSDRMPSDELALPPDDLEWHHKWVRVLDDGIRIPGTQIRFGLDPLIGMFFPVAGDAITGVGAATLLITAIRRRVPTLILLRMVMNIGIDSLVGAIPVLGDVFDFFWKANRRNLDLIEKFDGDPDAEPTAADYWVVGIGLSLIALGIAAPILIIWLISSWISGL